MTNLFGSNGSNEYVPFLNTPLCPAWGFFNWYCFALFNFTFRHFRKRDVFKCLGRPVIFREAVRIDLGHIF